MIKNDIAYDYRDQTYTEDKSLQRLGITYGVLRRIGFSVSRVDECLNEINGVGIEEALDWVSMAILTSFNKVI